MRIFYIDESNYMKFQEGPLSIGGIIASSELFEKHKNAIKNIKKKYGFFGTHELKWTKISNKTLPMYKEIIHYIFSENDFKIRIIIANKPQKLMLTYADWYNRIHYSLLEKSPFKINGIVSDKKGKTAEEKLNFTTEISLRGAMIVKNQYVRSEENILIQVADIIIGASAGYHKKNITSKAKKEFISYLSNFMTLAQSTSITFPNSKFNVFYMSGRR